MSAPPLLSSTYHAGGPVAYARDGNPTWDAFEAALGALEGGACIAFASGMGAITAVLETLPMGAIVVLAQQSYTVTRVFLEEQARAGRFGLRLVDATDTAAVVAAIDGASCVWFETVSNPLLDVADVPAIAAAARARGVLSVCDNTFLTPYVSRPLDVGVDVVIHSVTKFLSGHSDVVMGAVVTSRPAVCDAVRRKRSHYGAIPGPMEVWLASRGMRTLAVRLDRAQSNALELATRLSGHAMVERVRYPGLATDPWHARASAQLRGGYGAMVSFEVAGGAEAAEAMCCATKLAVHATSLGGVETMLERRRRWRGEADSTPPSLVRMSVGCEDVDDLWHDLDQALHVASRVAQLRPGPSGEG